MTMRRVFSAQEIVDAFIARTTRDDDEDRRLSTVTIGVRGISQSAVYGYIRIEGPNAAPINKVTPRVLVERYNGAVAFNHKGIAGHMSATTRPDDKYIWEDPCGASSGSRGNFGEVKWGLSPAEIAKRFGSADDFVAAIMLAYEKAGVPW